MTKKMEIRIQILYLQLLSLLPGSNLALQLLPLLLLRQLLLLVLSLHLLHLEIVTFCENNPASLFHLCFTSMVSGFLLRM